MVGYNKSAEHQLPEFWQGVTGISSGIISRLLFQPLDVLKIRFQLQHEPLKRSSENYYWSIKQASSRILKEESIVGLWKGHVPAQVLSGSYGLAQFLTFEVLTKMMSVKEGAYYSKTFVHFVCGCGSGGVATLISMPFDTVRTRLVGQGEPKVYKGVSHAFYTMIRTEGALSLYKGLVPNLMQIIPHTGMQFAFFNFFSEVYSSLMKTDQSEGRPMLGNLICGSGAGLLAKVAVYPFDLAKKRLQVQGFETARSRFGKIRIYTGMMDCLRGTVAEEGFIGLYKGLVPSCIKAMVTTGLVFTLYEEISGIFMSFRL